VWLFFRWARGRSSSRPRFECGGPISFPAPGCGFPCGWALSTPWPLGYLSVAFFTFWALTHLTPVFEQGVPSACLYYHPASLETSANAFPSLHFAPPFHPPLPQQEQTRKVPPDTSQIFPFSSFSSAFLFYDTASALFPPFSVRSLESFVSLIACLFPSVSPKSPAQRQ